MLLLTLPVYIYHSALAMLSQNEQNLLMKIYILEGNHNEYFRPTNCHVGMACSSCRFGRYSTAESNKDQTLAWRTLSNFCVNLDRDHLTSSLRFYL